jgi:hypothetical protein
MKLEGYQIVSPGSPVANTPWHGKRTTVQVVSAGNQVVSGATQSASKIGASPINISTPAPQTHTHISREQLSAMILPKRRRQVVNILQAHQGPQHVANTAAAGGPDALAGAETLHAKIAGEAVEISARRSKEQAVAGREYRSHLLRRIDPASSLNLSRVQSQVDGTELVKGFLSDGMLCDPQEMDDLIKNNRVHVLQSAVVLM